MEASIDTQNNNVSNIYRPLVPAQIIRTASALIPLLKNNYIEELSSQSKWQTPLRLVKKANDSNRVCLGFQGFNSLVKQYNYLIPNIMTLTDTKWNKKIFNKLVIKDAFFQIPLKKYDRTKTSF